MTRRRSSVGYPSELCERGEEPSLRGDGSIQELRRKLAPAITGSLQIWDLGLKNFS